MKTCISLAVALLLVAEVSADTFTAVIVLPEGNRVTPGEPLPVEVHGVLTSNGPGNDGLVFFSVDFALSGPQMVKLGEVLLLSPPADGSMDHFVRPLGFDANYGGTALGDSLVQAGGTQNTLGNNPDAEPYLESPAAEFIVFNMAYTQQVLLEGSLTLPPEADCGSYTLTLQNLRANVLSDGQRLESFGRYGVETTTPIVGGAAELIVPVDGDLDADGDVDVPDLIRLLSNWGHYEPCPPFALADFDEDCDVDVQDLLVLLENWG